MSNSDEDRRRWEKERLFLDSPSVPSTEQFNIVRRVYQQEALNREADYQQPRRRLGYKIHRLLQICGFGKQCFSSALPIVKWLPKYDVKRYLAGDIVAGLTVAVMHIPQGMGYALLAEVSPVVGLYMAFFPVLMYILLGTSPHVSMGTFAIACLMTGKIVTRHADTTHQALLNSTVAVDMITTSTKVYDPMQILSLVTLTVGCFQLLMWIFRLGSVATLLSDPLVSGFTTAAAFYVLSSQLKDLLGIKVPKMPNNFQVIFMVIAVCQRIPQANVAAVVISAITMTVIAINNELLKGWVAKKCSFPVPIELLAIVIGTLVSRFGDLQQRYAIRLVGDIPTGLPQPTSLPPLELLPQVALPCFTITMVTFTISMSMALIFASKAKYEVQGNQELLALGASNVFGSFFCCAPMCASLSRSYIQFQAGAKTNITSLVSCVCILCILLWVGPFFEQLPRSVLAGIIAVSLKGMFMQIKDLFRFLKLSYLDALVWMVTFLVTILINIDYGLGAGLLASIGTLFMRSQEAHTCLLGRVKDTDLYLDLKRYRAAEEIPGVKIFRYCGGLNFATKNHFRDAVFRKVGVLRSAEGDRPAESDSLEWDPHFSLKVSCVIIDATALCYVDAPGVKMLHDTEMEFARSNITVLLAGASGPVLEMIEKYNKFCPDTFEVPTFPTVHDAVIYYMVLMKKRYKQANEAKVNGNDTNVQINEHAD